MLDAKIFVATAIAFAILNAWFSSKRVTLSGSGDVFMLAWFYYGFSPSLDRLFGLTIEGIPGMVDLNGPGWPAAYPLGTLLYLLWGVGFVAAYGLRSAAGRRPTSRTGASSHNGEYASSPRLARLLPTPPLGLLVAAHVVLLAVMLREDYLTASRAERMMLAGDSMGLRITLLFVTLVRAFDILYLLRIPSQKRMLLVAALAAGFGLITGGRLEVVSIALIVALRVRLSLSRTAFACMLLSFLAVMAGWKSAHNYYAASIRSENLNRDVLEFSKASLTDIESYASWMVLCTLLDQECPWRYGSTYTWTVAQSAMPKELRSEDVVTPANDFGWTFTPDRAARGIGTGYSAIAEAWENFGASGALLLGVILGVLSAHIDRQPRDVAFAVLALIALRYFRSDAASLCKNTVVILGGAMVLASLAYALTGWSAAAIRSHRRRPSGRPQQSLGTRVPSSRVARYGRET